jgi:hypothetical protein
MTECKFGQTHFLDRPDMPGTAEASVVDHLTEAGVYAVMGIPTT